jgi:hypothetical protein
VHACIHRSIQDTGRSYTSVGALTGHDDELDDCMRERTASIDDAIHEDIMGLVRYLSKCIHMYIYMYM